MGEVMQVNEDKINTQRFSSEQLVEIMGYVRYAMAVAAKYYTVGEIQHALSDNLKLKKMSNKTYRVVCSLVGISGSTSIKSDELFEVYDILTNYLGLRESDTQFKNETDINKQIDMGLEHIGVEIKSVIASEVAIETFKRIAITDFIMRETLIFGSNNKFDTKKTTEYAHWLIKRIIEIDKAQSKGFKILSPSTISILNTIFGFKFRLQV